MTAKSTTKLSNHFVWKRGKVSSTFNFEYRHVHHVVNKFNELNGNVSELDDSIRKVLVDVTPEMCRQFMLIVRRNLQLCS